MQTPAPVEPQPDAPANTAPGCVSYGLLVLAGLTVVSVVVVTQGTLWLTEQFFQGTGGSMPGWISVLSTWGQVLLLGLPLALLAWFTKAPRLRAVYWAWAASALVAAIVSLARLLPLPVSALDTLVQIVLALLCAAALAVIIVRGRSSPRARRAYLTPALTLAPLIALPFVAWGALGSLLDTFLSAALGLSLGLVAALLLDGLVLRTFGRVTGGRGADLSLAALTAVVVLVLLASGFGLGGSPSLLMVVLPPLGLLAAPLGALARRAQPPRSAWLALAALVGLVAAAPLTFMDPDELVIALADQDIFSWAQSAAWTIFGLTVLIGLGALVWAAVVADPAEAQTPPPTRRSAVGTAIGLSSLGVAWLIALLSYGLVGQPGLYGDSFFIILADQADVSTAAAIPDRVERLTSVYTTLVAKADTTQADLRQLLDRLGVHYTAYYLVNSIEVDAGPLVRLYLSTRPEVGRIIDSPHLRPLPEPISEGQGFEDLPARPQWNIVSIGADQVWSELDVNGQGIVIGQSDSGVQGDHPALADGYRGWTEGDAYNWYDPWNHTLSPTDAGGHGTHTLGSALGRLGIGVAPGAEWMACVNLARNLANPPLYLDCMQFMLAPFPPGGDPLHAGDPSRAAHVLNNSWGCPPVEGCDALALQTAVAALRAAGIFVVASAGNSGPLCGSVDAPIALYDEVFTVGAVDRFGNLTDFSSRGPVTADGSNRLKPDLIAPGLDVLSATPGGTYASYPGTSMAGPHVVGTVALMWSANPALIGDIDRTEQILRDTATPYDGVVNTSFGDCETGPLPNNGVGYGLLNAFGAVQAALDARP